eukprot:scaffold36536_cov146-Isochrysis_galbana.AAC.2
MHDAWYGCDRCVSGSENMYVDHGDVWVWWRARWCVRSVICLRVDICCVVRDPLFTAFRAIIFCGAASVCIPLHALRVSGFDRLCAMWLVQLVLSLICEAIYYVREKKFCETLISQDVRIQHTVTIDIPHTS